MKLFHHTSVLAAESILSGEFRKGHLVHADGKIDHGVSWFTTEPTPDNHGLTLGNEVLNASQLDWVKRATQERKKQSNRTENKTLIRFTLEVVPEDFPALMQWTEYASKNEPKEFQKLLGLSAVLDLKTMSREEIQRALKVVPTKEKTWWISLFPVGRESVTAVEVNAGGKYVNYEFELHGRAALRDLGWVYVSSAALEKVRALLPSSHPLEQSKAFVFCKDPNHLPNVQVRGNGGNWLFDTTTGKLIDGPANEATPNISAWILDSRVELLARWDEAVDVYYEYFPNVA